MYKIIFPHELPEIRIYPMLLPDVWIFKSFGCARLRLQHPAHRVRHAKD